MLREGKQRFLVIVEGERVEPAILERCFEILNLGIDYEIVPFRTNVYQLIRHIDRFYGDDIDSIDIRKILKERNPDDGDALSGNFTDIILIFDYDPQDSLFDQGRLERLAPHFSDSSDLDRGRMFFNYPAVEALRDFGEFGERGYYESEIDCSRLLHHGYKRYVDSREPPARISDFRKITGPDLAEIIAMNVGKIQHLVDGVPIEGTVGWTRRPSLSVECLDLDLGGLLRLQGEKVAKGGCVYVCGTCLFFLCENWGSSIDGIWRKALS